MNIRQKTTLFLGLVAAGCAAPQSPPAAATPAAVASPTAPPASDAAGLFARFKQVTGGTRWDAITSLESKGSMQAGGLSGRIDVVQDTRAGRSVTRYTLGPIEGADGYDGSNGWSQDPGGEVTVLDAPESRQDAISDAWMSALGYFFPERAPAVFSVPSEREENGKHYRVIEATPRGGLGVTLWLDADSGELLRTVEKRRGDTITTQFGDYREISGGVRVPFHAIIDTTDAAGRTDPRQRVELHFESIVANVALADATLAIPEMAATARIDDASGVTRIPFELINNHIYANISIDGKPARVIVDTGGANILTPAAAQRLGIASEGKLAARGVGDEHVDLGFAHAGQVKLGGAILERTVFAVLDLGVLPRVEGIEADGLVGFEMFRRFRTSIDYQAHVLTLSTADKFTPPADAHVVPFDMAERIPVVTGTLDGLPIRISIDTGSRSSLTLHAPFVREHALIERYAAAPETVVGWGVGGPSLGRPARLGSLTLGDVVVKDIASDLYTGDKGAFANPDLGANLGGGILRRFNVSFDYDARKMYLVPNANRDKPDDFDRSGMWLFQGEGALEVAAVTPAGPAAKAGLEKGDLIVKIAGEAPAKRTLAEWRERLRTTRAGARLAIAFKRGDSAKTVQLVLADAIPTHALLH